MTRVWSIFHFHFVPSEKNAYRPGVLHRSWLVFFLALMLGAEGFLMTNIVARQSSEAFFAVVNTAGSTPMLASPSEPSQVFVQSVVKVLGNPRVVNLLLVGVAAVLLVALVLTFFVHIQIQPKDMLASGALVLGLALLFIYANNRFLLGGESLHQGVMQMASPAASL